MAGEETESNGRATVALVDAKVAIVEAKLDGLIELIRAEFKDFQRRLEDAAMLGAKVEGQGDRLLLLEGRVSAVEKRQAAEKIEAERRRNYRTVHLPSLLLGLVGPAAAILIFVAQH